MNVLCKPKKHNSYHRPNIAKPGAHRDYKSFKCGLLYEFLKGHWDPFRGPELNHSFPLK
jgi:hypothetical protein